MAVRNDGCIKSVLRWDSFLNVGFFYVQDIADMYAKAFFISITEVLSFAMQFVALQLSVEISPTCTFIRLQLLLLLSYVNCPSALCQK